MLPLKWSMYNFTGPSLLQECLTGEDMRWPVGSTCCTPAPPTRGTWGEDWDWSREPPETSCRTGPLTCRLWRRWPHTHTHTHAYTHSHSEQSWVKVVFPLYWVTCDIFSWGQQLFMSSSQNNKDSEVTSQWPALPLFLHQEESILSTLVRFGIRSGKTGNLAMEVDGLTFHPTHSDIITRLLEVTRGSNYC